MPVHLVCTSSNLLTGYWNTMITDQHNPWRAPGSAPVADAWCVAHCRATGLKGRQCCQATGSLRSIRGGWTPQHEDQELKRVVKRAPLPGVLAFQVTLARGLRASVTHNFGFAWWICIIAAKTGAACVRSV